jgi:hypothetical protein
MSLTLISFVSFHFILNFFSQILKFSLNILLSDKRRLLLLVAFQIIIKVFYVLSDEFALIFPNNFNSLCVIQLLAQTLPFFP